MINNFSVNSGVGPSLSSTQYMMHFFKSQAKGRINPIQWFSCNI